MRQNCFTAVCRYKITGKKLTAHGWEIAEYNNYKQTYIIEKNHHMKHVMAEINEETHDSIGNLMEKTQL